MDHIDFRSKSDSPWLVNAVITAVLFRGTAWLFVSVLKNCARGEIEFVRNWKIVVCMRCGDIARKLIFT